MPLEPLSRQELLGDLAKVLREEAWRADFIRDRMPFVAAGLIDDHLYGYGRNIPRPELHDQIVELDIKFEAAEFERNYGDAYRYLIERVRLLQDVEVASTATAYQQATEYAVFRDLPEEWLDSAVDRERIKTVEFMLAYEDPTERVSTLQALLDLIADSEDPAVKASKLEAALGAGQLEAAQGLRGLHPEEERRLKIELYELRRWLAEHRGQPEPEPPRIVKIIANCPYAKVPEEQGILF
jgi:hypothetical protein